MKAFRLFAIVSVMSFFLYLGVASWCWQWNNPKANQLTFWKDFPDALKFKKMEKYQ